MMMEARERRKVEKPRLPRTAKKLDTSRMTREMGDLGVDVDVTGNVSADSCVRLCGAVAMRSPLTAMAGI